MGLICDAFPWALDTLSLSTSLNTKNVASAILDASPISLRPSLHLRETALTCPRPLGRIILVQEHVDIQHNSHWRWWSGRHQHRGNRCIGRWSVFWDHPYINHSSTSYVPIQAILSHSHSRSSVSIPLQYFPLYPASWVLKMPKLVTLMFGLPRTLPLPASLSFQPMLSSHDSFVIYRAVWIGESSQSCSACLNWFTCQSHLSYLGTLNWLPLNGCRHPQKGAPVDSIS